MTPTTLDSRRRVARKSRATLREHAALGACRGGRPSRACRRRHRPGLGPARCTAERAAALRRRTLRLCADAGRRHDRRGAARRRRRDHRRLHRHGQRDKWCRCRSGRACSDASSIRSAGRSTAASRSHADGHCRSNGPRRRSSSAIWSPSRLQTGILLIDALFAIGRGQRELIIGDRATGKTSIALDTIVDQKGTDMICVYVAIGQSLRRWSAPSTRCAARRAGALHLRVRRAAAPPGAAMDRAVRRHDDRRVLRDRGQHALVVIDDLTKHAATHRELALLTRQPPGREAYPGDVFYLHARLLERAAKLSPSVAAGR